MNRVSQKLPSFSNVHKPHISADKAENGDAISLARIGGQQSQVDVTDTRYRAFFPTAPQAGRTYHTYLGHAPHPKA
jgi:hypothetical protein